MARFYGHFAAAYGTFWLVMVVLAVLTQSHVDAGLFGLLGFPIISLIYAAFRVSGVSRAGGRHDQLSDHRP